MSKPIYRIVISTSDEELVRRSNTLREAKRLTHEEIYRRGIDSLEAKYAITDEDIL